MVGGIGFIAKPVVGGDHGKLPLIRISQTDRHIEYERLLGDFSVADFVEEFGGREKKKRRRGKEEEGKGGGGEGTERENGRRSKGEGNWKKVHNVETIQAKRSSPLPFKRLRADTLPFRASHSVPTAASHGSPTMQPAAFFSHGGLLTAVAPQ
ncbi:uncharacterized protein Triagg1_7903 [Trichoderma aggressivum f. europaeum]|uniref:Uncharacterized protein n=1 Tax=Trichoderma aggressivum f. europaeum TaxID=173218 RepID=A0AAE1IB21_9HYPO|nr:hypothetical protein Triagg1_7903 [Trichoderma aggressivum f. europaeum]